MMAKLRAAPPSKVGVHAIVATSDFDAQTKKDASGKTTPLSLPKSNVLSYDLDGGSRIIARPSGTEPKIKFYFDVREEMRAGESLAEAEARAGATMKALADAWTKLATGT